MRWSGRFVNENTNSTKAIWWSTASPLMDLLVNSNLKLVLHKNTRRDATNLQTMKPTHVVDR